MVDPRVLAEVTLGGMLLDLLGGLYLAYDLLGAEKGPLLTVTRWATYTLPFSLVYGLVLGPPFAFVAGPALGLALALELLRMPSSTVRRLHARPAAFGVLRGAALGVAGWLTYGRSFGIIFGVLSSLGLNLAYLAGSSPTYQRQVDSRPGFTWSRLRATAARGLAVGAAALVAGLASSRGLSSIPLALKIGAVVAGVGGIVSASVPVIESWAGTLPPRRLGLFGVILLLLGVLLQSVQYWVTLLS